MKNHGIVKLVFLTTVLHTMKSHNTYLMEDMKIMIINSLSSIITALVLVITIPVALLHNLQKVKIEILKVDFTMKEDMLYNHKKTGQQ